MFIPISKVLEEWGTDSSLKFPESARYPSTRKPRVPGTPHGKGKSFGILRRALGLPQSGIRGLAQDDSG